MSLSQKHAGLILVPWFNSDEWRYVYHSVYSNDRDKQIKALDMLRIWKLRTPILSAGVEGTLILLDALLLDTETISTEQVCNLYAIALMRFLNLSAANSEKQGSFTKASMKNELPKWLINLRHDIAHGLQIPSLYNLKIGLDFGFKWIKDKYWEPQSRLIQDYYIEEDSIPDSNLSSSLKAYSEINMALFENQELDNEEIKKMKDTIYKKFRKTVAHPFLMLDILLEMVKQCLDKDHRKDQINLDMLVSTKALLKPNFEIVSEEEGNEKLDKNFRDIWNSLLNMLHQYGLLFVLLNKLFNVLNDLSYSDNSKKMAGMWINELLISLNNHEEEEPFILQSNIYSYIEESVEFKNQVLKSSNKYSSYFLESLLTYNSPNDHYNNDIQSLIKAGSNLQNMHLQVDKTYCLEDLRVENLSLEDFVLSNGNDGNYHNCSDSSQGILVGPKWRKIEDTRAFKNCPLGVLPHQINQKHPFLGLR